LSVITKIEVLGFNAPGNFSNLLSSFIDDSTVLDLTENVVNATIEIRKKHKIKLPDAIIAATALVYGLVLITRNVVDFKNIDNMNIINPHSLDDQENNII
jgi:predicted nucleic acid-binding protein